MKNRCLISFVMCTLALGAGLDAKPIEGREPIRVALTFDDGLKDHLLIAAPMLEERGWRGTFNIVTDWIGKSEKFMTWEDVRELVQRGHEVVTHTKTHRELTKLGEDQIRREFRESRDLIAAKTGFAPRFMCSPFVQQNEATARVCREEGLRQMLTCRTNFGKGKTAGSVRREVALLVAQGRRRWDFLCHGISAVDHGGWNSFPNREEFRRHMDEIAALEREGAIIVTDYDGMMSDCSLKAKPWPRHGVVALSFDDQNYRSWEDAFPLFSKYRASATFFCSGTIGTNEIAFMKKVLAAGHEIGLHARHHRDADSGMGKLGTNEYWQTEIESQLGPCRAAGIPVFSFAYPNTRRNAATDEIFFSHGFTRLRGRGDWLNPNPHDPRGEKLDKWHPVATYDHSFEPATDYLTTRVIHGVIMGGAYHTDIDDIMRCLERAGERGELFAVLSHAIAKEAIGINMRTEWLERMLKSADELGVIIRGVR